MRHGEFRDPRLVPVYDAAFGWSVDAVYGGWSQEAVGHSDGELLVVAHR